MEDRLLLWISLRQFETYLSVHVKRCTDALQRKIDVDVLAAAWFWTYVDVH